MVPRKCQRQSEGVGSSKEQDYDRSRFVNFSTMAMFNNSSCIRKSFLREGSQSRMPILKADPVEGVGKIRNSPSNRSGPGC